MSILKRDIDALLGFMSEAEAIEFQRDECVPPDGEDEAARSKRWRDAEERVRPLAPIPNFDAEVKPLGGAAQKVADALVDERLFKLAFQRTPLQFGSVNPTRLIAAQKYVDLGHLEELRPLPDPADEVATLQFCMKRNPIDPPLMGSDGGVSFSSHYAGNLLALPPTFDRMNEHEVKVSTSVVSRPNYVQVVVLGNRFLIANGYHRAVALLKAGHKRLPCIVRPIQRLEDINFVPPVFFDIARIGSHRPPMVPDFLDNAVRLQRRARNHILRVGLVVQASFEAPR